MAPQPFRLVMRSGPTPGKTFELVDNEISIGRDISNDVVINDAEVSRKHARLYLQAGGWVLEDTGSTNGTFVNGQRLMGPHLMRSGEVIVLGENVNLLFERYQFDPDATMVAASNVPSMPPSTSREEYPPQEPYYPQERPAPPPPVYAEPYPGGPAQVYDVRDEEEPSPSRTWLYAGCGCLVVLLCVLVGAAFLFDTLNLYCTPPFNAIFPC